MKLLEYVGLSPTLLCQFWVSNLSEHCCVRTTSEVWNAFSSERSFQGTLNHDSNWLRDEWDISIQNWSLGSEKWCLKLISHIENNMRLSCLYILEHPCGVYLCLMCYAPSPTCARGCKTWNFEAKFMASKAFRLSACATYEHEYNKIRARKIIRVIIKHNHIL